MFRKFKAFQYLTQPIDLLTTLEKHKVADRCLLMHEPNRQYMSVWGQTSCFTYLQEG